MIAARLRQLCVPLAVTVVLAAGTAMAQQHVAPSGQGMPGQGMPRQDMPGHEGMKPGQGHAMPTDPASRAYMQGMRKMNRAMGQPMTGNADQDFARMMAAHHQGAIDMARVELEHGTDPALKAMAQKIVDDQTREIQQLQDWMKQHPAKPAPR